MPRVRRKLSLNKFRDEFLGEILKQEIDNVEKTIIPEIAKAQAEDYLKTVKYWGLNQPEDERGRPSFVKPHPNTTFKRVYANTKKGLKYVITSQMLDSHNHPSALWNWLDQGRASFVQGKTSPPIFKARPLQTSPGDLEMRYSPNISDLFVIKAGDFVSAYAGRNWSIIIAIRSESNSRKILSGATFAALKVTKAEAKKL